VPKPRFFLLDSAAVAYRAYFGFIKNPLVNSAGLNTSAVFGFTNILLWLLEKENPEYFVAVFDTKAPTFRHETYPAYKATREKMPDDMAASLPYIDEVVQALGLPMSSLKGFEADDVIGTLVHRASLEKMDSYIVSGDKDFMQLIGPGVWIYNPKKPDDLMVVDESGVREKFGVKPNQVIDMLALMGDASDNVPGVPGVGEKTAQALIQEYGSLEAIHRNIAKIPKEKLRQKLQENWAMAELSKDLVTIRLDAPVKGEPREMVRMAPDLPRLRELFAELEFNRLMGRVEHYAQTIQLKTSTKPKVEKREDDFKLIHEGEPNEKPEMEQTGLNLRAPAGHYRTLRTEEEIKKALTEAAKAERVAVDTETTGLDSLSAELVGVSLSWKEKEAVYIPFNDVLKKDKVLSLLKPFLENPKIEKGGQNSKYDWAVFRTHGLEPKGFAFDTMVESYLLDPSIRQHNLDAMALKYFHHVKIPTEELIGKGLKQVTMAEVPVEVVSNYSCEDADFTFRLHQLFTPRLKRESLEKLYHEVELPLVMVLEDMERKGIAIDPVVLKKLSEKAGVEIEKLTASIYLEAGGEFNIGSPQQLGKVLFDQMQVQKKVEGFRVKRTKTGYATDVDVLEALKGVPVADRVLEYRQLSKLKNTYLDVLPALASAKDGRVHTSFNQAVTATGRLSSADPNLQNIPIRTEIGRKVRAAFVAKDSKHLLISADYSQIELRVLAHLSGDKGLMETFERDEDVHAHTASRIFSVPLDQVTKTQRGQAKTINFGVIYGMGPQRLARENGVTLAEAKKFIEEYFTQYPKIKEYTEAQILEAQTKGFVTTILGRKRPLPDIHSTNPGLRINAEHMAVNTPIQGSAADLIKVAMVRIHALLAKEGYKTAMLLQVHDELVFEAPKGEVDDVKKMIKREMEGAIKLNVPLRVDVGAGANWLEAH
jgi:DNA polymerase-1